MAITECKEQHRIQDETRRGKFETVKNGEIVAESMKQCILQGGFRVVGSPAVVGGPTTMRRL
jgi:hypothetical protein